MILDIPADLETGAPPRSKGVDKELADAVEKQMQGLMPEELKTRPYMSKLITRSSSFFYSEKTVWYEN